MTTQLASAAAPDRIPFADCHIAAGSRRAAHRVLESGWVTTGPEVAAFEAEFAAYVGAAHAIAVSSCTAALELSLRYLRLPQGAPVLVSDLTFCGAVQAILHAGLRSGVGPYELFGAHLARLRTARFALGNPCAHLTLNEAEPRSGFG